MQDGECRGWGRVTTCPLRKRRRTQDTEAIDTSSTWTYRYCGALGKQANCQVAVSVHGVTDTASCLYRSKSHRRR